MKIRRSAGSLFLRHSVGAQLLIVSALLAVGVETVIAQDDPVTAIQKELKRRQFYTGEANGTLDAATIAAVKQFQERSGLKANGEIDTATLQALDRSGQSVAKASENETLPEVSARERAQSIEQSDHEFLAGIESNTSSQLPGPAVVPGRSQPNEKITEFPEPVGELLTEERRGKTSTRASQGDSEVADFVANYLQVAQGPSPQSEAAFYGEEVDYFDSGLVGKSFIEKDQTNYYRRWPVRDFTLLAPPQIEGASPQGVNLRFKMRYAVRNAQETATGQTENLVRIKKGDDGWKIVAIRERKLRE